MNHICTFSGIGGFALAARWAGFETVEFVEIDPYCQQVLAKNFPGVPIHGDIKTYSPVNALRRRGIDHIDLLTGGFPCQPYSVAGKQLGDKDDRALWHEMFRVIEEVRPRFVVAENVANIVNMALDGVLSDLERLGYSCGTAVIPACAVNAPHRRDRVWIVAHSRYGTRRDFVPPCERRDAPTFGRSDNDETGRSSAACGHGIIADACGERGRRRNGQSIIGKGQEVENSSCTSADTDCQRLQGREPSERVPLELAPANGCGRNASNSESAGQQTFRGDGMGNEQQSGWRFAPYSFGEDCRSVSERWREIEPLLRGSDDGLPGGLDKTGNLSAKPKKKRQDGRAHRLRGLGNAIVPQVAFQILNEIARQINDRN